MKLTLIGMEIERYVVTDYAYNSEDSACLGEESERYRLVFAKHPSLILWRTSSLGTCGYGYQSWGRWEWDDTQKPYSYVPVTGPVDVDICVFDGTNRHQDGYTLIVNSCDSNHRIAEVVECTDGYYPDGYVKIDKSFFKPTRRTIAGRPVWIFIGPSGLGKSTLAACCGDKVVFETDSVKNLPNQILADIIVVGNKHHFSVKAIKKRLPSSAQPILVNFTN